MKSAADREVTPSVAAKILHVHVHTVRAWVERRRFQTSYKTPSNRIFIRSSEVYEVLERNKSGDW